MKKSQLRTIIREEISTLKKSKRRKYLAEGRLLKEKIETLPNPFWGFEGVFISKDGGDTGIFITNDPTFDSGEYETVGEKYQILGFTVLEVFS